MIINVCSFQSAFSLQTIHLDDTFCLCDGRKQNTSRRRRRTGLSESLAYKSSHLTTRHRISTNRICVDVLFSYYANNICDSMKSMSSL